ncbi:hypothetical protein [Niabella hibiscisoli]|uniref:hypothetical protein n=1 Tax=Niabella hibiscisoli TaxID=1825928 RepID=UPI001F0D8727|nr:hypothetical protein [Niabella hibiscisoli]MCH5718508.1 hypothetical protein [Niabella hibiscisoli]
MEKSRIYLAGALRSIRDKYPAFMPPSKKLQYVIGNGYFNSLEYFNFYNYFSTFRFIKDNNTVIDVIAGGYYRHELIHYVLSNYKFNKFLNEGMAALLSGGEVRYGSSTGEDWKEIQGRIAMDKSYINALNNTDSLLMGSYKPEMYGVSALLLHKYRQKVGEAQFYKILFEKLLFFSEAASIQFLKTELE